jgi:hypothetical protein
MRVRQSTRTYHYMLDLVHAHSETALDPPPYSARSSRLTRDAAGCVACTEVDLVIAPLGVRLSSDQGTGVAIGSIRAAIDGCPAISLRQRGYIPTSGE